MKGTETVNDNNNYEYKPKSIKIDISKEDEEDRELISLLEEKRKFYFFIFIILFYFMKIALTSQNKYKKKILFDVIEEEEDEDKNKNNKNKNIKKSLDIDVLKSMNTENNNRNDIFIDTKYSNINSNNNNLNKNNKDVVNNDDSKKINFFSKINNNYNPDKKIELLFDSKIKNIDKKENLKWNHSSNIKNYETEIFNKFSKDSNLVQKIFRDPIKEKERDRHLLLPNINSKNLFEKKNEVSNQINIDPINDLKSINFIKSKVINMNSNNYINDNTQATTLLAYSTKKLSSSKINNIKTMNGDLTHYGMGLISAGSTTNNNIIIPILTKVRPESNFNCGGSILKNFNENFENNGKNRTIESDKNIRQNKSRNFRKKICKSQEIQKRINASMKNKEIYRPFPDIQKIMPNFHKIKIEKGMNGIKL